MDRSAKTQILVSVYLLYKHHAKELQKAGFSALDAFWLNLTCLPFLPWDEYATDKILLTEVLRLYVGIYQYSSQGSLRPEDVPAFIELLADRYRMAKQAVSGDRGQEAQVELMRFVLPRETDAARCRDAATIVMSTIMAWQEQTGQEQLPCALWEDIES
jgi:hypothetical protein